MIALAVWAALCSLVVLGGVISVNDLALGTIQPKNAVTEFSLPLLPEDIFIKDDSPDTYSPISAPLNLVDLVVVNKIWNGSVDDDVLVRSQNEAGSEAISALGEIEVIGQRVWQNTSRRPIRKIMSGSMARIENYRPDIKPQTFVPLLIKTVANNDREIGAHLHCGTFSEHFGIGQCSLSAQVDTLSDVFHGGSGPQGFGYGSLHVTGLGSRARTIDLP